jgi:hypothetical protein
MKLDFPPLARYGHLNHNRTVGRISERVMNMSSFQTSQKSQEIPNGRWVHSLNLKSIYDHADLDATVCGRRRARLGEQRAGAGHLDEGTPGHGSMLARTSDGVFERSHFHLATNDFLGSSVMAATPVHG